MKRQSIFRTLVSGLCCVTLLSGQLVQAASPTLLGTSQVADVALTSSGELRGQVLDTAGIPQSEVRVAIGKAGQQPTFVATDAEGQFSVEGLTAGVYQVATAAGSATYRVWAPHTAPPAAQPGVLLVNDGQVVRGFGHGAGHFLANPWAMGLIVAAAIAIPLAIDSGS